MEEILDSARMEASFAVAEPMLYADIVPADKPRLLTGIPELNRVLGGGVVVGSLQLSGGAPGIGKSTLLLQVSREFASRGTKVLYVSGEESLEQVKLRGERLGVREEPFYLLAETNLERILEQAERLHPQVLILDSVQTVLSGKLSSGPGTISQVREVANQIFRFSKKNAVSSFLIGHITKDGALAGPKSLEHMVDAVLYFEGERDHSYRVLRALKNRFGPVSELAIFEMTHKGLQALANPSAFFLREKPENEPGSVVVCTIQGSRPLLAEVQALVSSTLFSGNPRRMSVGFDHFRSAMLLAILEKKLGLSFAGEDVYLNIPGGLVINEPAVDLGVATAVVSCLKNKPVPADMTLLGEVGLSGEIRSVGDAVLRIKEAASMGFRAVLLPQANISKLEKEESSGLQLIGVKTLREAIDNIF